MAIEIVTHRGVEGLHLAVSCTSAEGVQVFTIRTSDTHASGFALSSGERRQVIVTISHRLRAGFFEIGLGCYKNSKSYFFSPSVARLEVSEVGRDHHTYEAKNYGIVNADSAWMLE
jgi:hypothetical protein